MDTGSTIHGVIVLTVRSLRWDVKHTHSECDLILVSISLIGLNITQLSLYSNA